MRGSTLRLGRMLGLSLVAQVVALTGAVAQTEIGASDWVGELGEVPARSRLISATTGVGHLDQLRIGVEIELEPGFKTYWRTPGGPGFPTSIDWEGSTNLDEAEFKWPGPTRFDVLGFDSLGYKEHVIFPVLLRPQVPGQPVQLRANVAYLACDEICVPMTTELALDLPARPADASQYANQIDQFRAKVPVTDGTLVGLNLEGVGLQGTAEAPVIKIAFSGTEPFISPDVFVEGPEDIEFGRPEVAVDGTTAVFSVSARDVFVEGPIDLAGQPLLVTLVENDRALETRVTPQWDGFDVAALSPAIASGGETGVVGPGVAGASRAPVQSLWVILGFALLGGMILNVFPCVLPVLSIKLLSVISHGGGHSRQVRTGFLASVAGIIAAFLVLATGLVGLKAAGQTVGWGIQFQQPLFLVGMVLILTLFACNMWGLFEIRLPGTVADAAVRHSGGTSLRGHFFSGGFTTLLATPCTAPFLSSAVGFALTRGAGEVYAVFTALGVGLAMPFILVAAFPSVVTKLPRPGPWMVTVKKVLSLALVATAVWLLSIMAGQVSVLTAALVAVLMVVVAVVIGARKLVPAHAGAAVPAAVAAAAILAFATPVLLPRTKSATSQVEQRTAVNYLPFDQAAIPGLVSAGSAVLVHVTADWCITCKVNEKRVLEVGEVATALARDDVVVMEADWTRPNDDIASYLASFGRFGIPFDVVYGQDTPNGRTLPELLTANAVMSALSGASPTLRLALNQ